ncbi:uncharacterized protein LOC34619016 [Cyclospora cayetanensis]|uniref:Uncharacterized protein LOC34619016 n=1 Tax=Cyclospora cayetanensis TaxID=88456 RepID=A0A6P6S066_9EIME|nr:uncharacterized protein LOC34619016 [Cyclospora cayetanensis]
MAAFCASGLPRRTGGALLAALFVVQFPQGSVARVHDNFASQFGGGGIQDGISPHSSKFPMHAMPGQPPNVQGMDPLNPVNELDHVASPLSSLELPLAPMIAPLMFGSKTGAGAATAAGWGPTMGIGSANYIPPYAQPSGMMPGSGAASTLASKLRSQKALAASLPVITNKAGDVMNADPVVDTSVPVGFLSSANGVYLAPRFPSTLQAVAEPSEDALKSCIMRVSVRTLTNEFSDTLKWGSVKVEGSSVNQLLQVLSTSAPRFTSKLAAPMVLLQRAAGARVKYNVKLAVPKGCALLPNDQTAMVLVKSIGSYIYGVDITLRPDMMGQYMPSVVGVPSDLIAFASKLPENSNFQPVGHCAFVARFSASPEEISLGASFTRVRIVALTQYGSEALELQIPIECLPQSLHRTALWSTKLSSGTAVFVAFSPPPRDDNEWFPIRHTDYEVDFQSATTSHR